MLKCPRCSAEAPASQRFCGSCGSAIIFSSQTGTLALPGGGAASRPKAGQYHDRRARGSADRGLRTGGVGNSADVGRAARHTGLQRPLSEDGVVAGRFAHSAARFRAAGSAEPKPANTEGAYNTGKHCCSANVSSELQQALLRHAAQRPILSQRGEVPDSLRTVRNGASHPARLVCVCMFR